MYCEDIAINLMDKAEKPLRIARYKGQEVSEEQKKDVKIYNGALSDFLQELEKYDINVPIIVNNDNPLRKVHTTSVLISIVDVLPTGELIFSKNQSHKTYDILILLRIRECLLNDNNTITSADIAKEFDVNDGTVSKLVTAVKQGKYAHIYKKWEQIQQNPIKYDKNGQLVF